MSYTRYDFLKQECPGCTVIHATYGKKEWYQVDCGKNRAANFGMEPHETDSKRIKWVRGEE